MVTQGKGHERGFCGAVSVLSIIGPITDEIVICKVHQAVILTTHAPFCMCAKLQGKAT